MKVKSFRAPRIVMATVAQGRTILRGAWSVFCRHKLLAVWIAVVGLILGGLIWPHDMALLKALHIWPAGQEKIASELAHYFSNCGDYTTYNVPLALALWVYGVATNSSAWRRIAMISFLGATLAGLFNDFFRLTLGRPRPDTLQEFHLSDGFYGISHAFSGGFQSFPSGHAASVFGTASALLVTRFPLGVATTLFALAVIWARMELYRHYPSDIAVGCVIGLYFGTLVGFGAKAHACASR